VNRDGPYFRVPKRDIVGELAVSLQNKRLKIAAALPDAETLINELLAFKVKVNLKTAHDSYEAWRGRRPRRPRALRRNGSMGGDVVLQPADRR